MLDPAFVREHPDQVRTGLQNRGLQPEALLAELAALEERRRGAHPGGRDAQARAERVGRGSRTAEATGTGSVGACSTPTGSAPSGSSSSTRELESLEGQRQASLLVIPNLPHASVPVGRSADDNLEVRRVGEPPAFDFAPKAHWDLGPALGIIDFERAAKIAGARFAFLLGAGARLSRALIDFMLDLHTREHGYREVEPPFMVNAASLTGTGNLPKFEQDLFKIAGDWDLYLVPTAEVPLTNMHRGEILDGRDAAAQVHGLHAVLPQRGGIVRRGRARADPPAPVRQGRAGEVHDAGAVVRRARGADRERGDGAAAARAAYRTVLLCTGDMGFASAKTYDIEVWLPGQNTYREISSCSNTEAFQARRANIKFRPGGTGKAEFVHTLNGSGLAVGRTLIAILENYQQKDGSVRIPEALQPYMRGLQVIEPA